MTKINSAPCRHLNVSRRQHYEREDISCSPMQDDDLSATYYQQKDLSKHYYTPPRGGEQKQQHDQHPSSQNHQHKKKSKRILLSRASEQFNQKPHHIHVEENYNEEEKHIREAKDPSPTNEMKYAILLDNGDRNVDSVMKRVRLPEDNWTGPRIVKVHMDVATTPTFPNQTNHVAIKTVPHQLEEFAILPKTMLTRSSAATTPPTPENCYQGEIKQKSNVNMNMRNVVDQRHTQQKLIDSSKDNEIHQLRQKVQYAVQEKEGMKHKVDELKYQLAQREKEMEKETFQLREELRKQKQKMEEMQTNTNAKAQEYETKVECDLEAYKRKCSMYREQLLKKERENAKVEQNLYNERKRVLSLESENETLINVAEEKVANVMTSEKAKSSELKRYKDQIEKYRNERAKTEQAVYNERKKVLSLEAENEMLIKAAEEKVGSVMTLEKAKSSELRSYMEQCERYRERVLGLERKVISTESALRSTSSIATTLEEEKKVISSELSQVEANVATLKSEISDKDAKIGSLQSEIANLQSTSSNLEAALRCVQSKNKLESENASLLDQLKEKSMLVEKLHKTSAKYKEIEEENASVKRKNDELTAKELLMKEEMSKSEVFSSNTERLRKMLSDSESYISSLQNDLSSARTSHHQQLTDAREKYSSEIHSITAQLETQISAKREIEMKNNDLEDKILSLERKLPEIEDLRRNLSESTQKVSSLKRELASNERTVTQLRSKIQVLEGEKSVITSLQADLSQAQTSHSQQLLNFRSQHSSKIEDINAHLETQIAAKRDLEIKNNNLEDKVLLLESKMAEIEDQSANQSKSQSQQLFKLMEHAEILRKKLSETIEEMSVVKRKLDTSDRTATQLRSKIQSLEEEKLGMSEKIEALKCELRDYTKEKTAQITELQKYIKERDDVLAKNERIISSEATKNLQQIEGLKHLKEKFEVAEGEKNILQDKMRQLSERNEKEINELKRAFDFDRKAQDVSVDSLIASKEEELHSMRTASEELKGQIEKLTEEAVQLQKHSESCEAELKGCQEELSAVKEECSRLDKKLIEETRSYQEKADNLTEHYMKIEDEIRTQLNTSWQKKDTAEKKLAAVKKETDRLMDEFYSQKKEMSSRIMELKEQLNIVSNERDTLQRGEEVLKSTIVAKEKEAKELQESVDTMKDQLQKDIDSLKNEMFEHKSSYECEKKKLSSRVMELTDQLDIVSNERNTLQREEEVLKSTIAAKGKEAKELQETVDTMQDQLQSASKEVSEKAKQQSLQNTIPLYQKPGTSKSQLKPIVVDVHSGDVGAEAENEVNATPSNHKKKRNNKKTRFQYNESPKVAKAKENAAFALGSPRGPLAPRTSNTHFNFDGWISPRTPRSLEINGTVS